MRVAVVGGAAADTVSTGVVLDKVSKNCPVLFTVTLFPLLSVAVALPVPIFAGGLITEPLVVVIVPPPTFPLSRVGLGICG